MHLTHALFIGEQFLVDNSSILDQEPESFTSTIYTANKYNRKFNYRLKRIREIYGEYQSFLLVSSYVFAYSVFDLYQEDVFNLVGEIRGAKCKELQDTSLLESLFTCLGSTSLKHFDKNEIDTMNYIRWRRNCLIHAEGKPSASLVSLIKNEGPKINKFWQGQGVDLQSLDFSSKSVESFSESELIAILVIMRNLAAKIDQQVLGLLKLDDVVSFAVSEFKKLFADKIKQRTKSRVENMFANFIRMKFDISKKDLDFSKITF
jgi:hypothetical protein